MTAPVPVRGVLLTEDTAAFAASVLRYLIKVLAAQGRRPVPRVFELERDLSSSADSSVDVTSELALPQPDPEWSQLLDTEAAAEALGCSPENVRALCRRGTLPARLASGRWVIDADAVHARLLKARKTL